MDTSRFSSPAAIGFSISVVVSGVIRFFSLYFALRMWVAICVVSLQYGHSYSPIHFRAFLIGESTRVLTFLIVLNGQEYCFITYSLVLKPEVDILL